MGPDTLNPAELERNSASHLSILYPAKQNPQSGTATTAQAQVYRQSSMNASRMEMQYRGLPVLSTRLGVPMIRCIAFWGLHWGTPIGEPPYLICEYCIELHLLTLSGTQKTPGSDSIPDRCVGRVHGHTLLWWHVHYYGHMHT